jgi:hypothetical protein
MHVTLVYPSMGRRVRAAQMQPLTIAALAGLTPDDIDLGFFDDRIEDVDYDAPTDLAGISVHTYSARRAYEIAAEFRRRKVPVVLGGFHVREPLRRCLISKRRIGRERFSTFGPRIVGKKRLQACLLCLGSPFSGLQRHYAP